MYKSEPPSGTELCEDVEKRAVKAHQSEGGYKTISKRVQLYPSTAKQMIYKLRAFDMTATLPRSGRPSKLSTRSTTKIQNQIKGSQHITSRELQTFLVAPGTKASAAII